MSVNYPTTDEPSRICDITSLLCNKYIKVANYTEVDPYSFGMNLAQWEELKKQSPLEYDLALLFAISNDISGYSDIFWVDSARNHRFHTNMYVRFNNYVMSAVVARGAIAISNLQTFTLTFGTPEISFKGAYETYKLTKSTISDIEVVTQAQAILINRGPLIINEKLFFKIFNKKYDSQMLSILKQHPNYKAINRIEDLDIYSN